ncbi:MAG: hypothetical protein BGO01_19515 [Armatimonadetes bacterium 55-13]|nr:flagellar assembly protein FliW [Armatimonadota bacterium]OJU64304.1 MAG: hypothetical protein BGO01_19515 [Armatimonadetes bacterium 55-13]
MTILGTRFGDIDYSADDIITFEDGMIGFPKHHRYILLNTKPDTAFRWLQSLDEPTLAFLVAFPEMLVSGYSPLIDDRSVSELELTEECPKLLLTTVTIPPGKPNDMTTNLLGPIIVNGATMKAKQVVLQDDAYTVRHRVFAVTEKVAERAVA